MNLKEFVPGYGEKSTRKRIHELERRAGTLPVMFALFFTEAIKIAALEIPLLTHGMGVTEATADVIRMLLLSVIVGSIYIYDIDIDDVEEVVE